MKLSIVIPVYNEEKTVKIIIDKVRKADIASVKKEIVVVDDGSSDRTAEILSREQGIKLLKHGKNKGKGAAIRTGIKNATGDIIIIQDADLEYDPNDYMKLISPIMKGEASVVYGSRNLNSKNKMHSKRSFYIGGIILTMITNLLYNTKLTDESTCYKVFKRGIIKSINLECDRFEFCPEVTAKVAKKGIKILEVPITYTPRHFDEGKKIKWSDGVAAIQTLLKYRFSD